MKHSWSSRHVLWSEENEALLAVRTLVFVEEQKVPAELEQDEWDQKAHHVLVEEHGKPIACGRLLPDGSIGRLAVLASHRGKGIGKVVLNHLLKLAKEYTYPRVELHAQVQAISFYEKFGFRTVGKTYYEAGILHQNMVLELLS